jgi:hypothetical protein
VPIWGVYSMLIGQVINEIVCKIVNYYHNEIVKRFEVEYEEKKRCGARSSQADTDSSSRPEHGDSQTGDLERSGDNMTAMCEVAFTRPHGVGTAKLLVRPLVKYVVALLCVITIGTLLAASILPLFSIEVSGLLGNALDFGVEADHSREFTLFSILKGFAACGKMIGTWKTNLGLTVLAVFFIGTVIITPTLESLSLLILWLRPMELSAQVQLQVLIDQLETWQYNDMFFFAMFVCGMQGDRISKLLVSAYCKWLKNTLRSLVYWGFIDETDDQCVILSSSISFSTLGFLAVYFSLALLRGFLGSAIAHKLKDAKSKSKSMEMMQENYDRENLQQQIEKLKPDPVCFTDRFRWALKSEYKGLELDTTIGSFIL